MSKLDILTLIKGSAVPVKFLILRSIFKKPSFCKFYCDRKSTYRGIWGKPDFPPERILNHAN